MICLYKRNNRGTHKLSLCVSGYAKKSKNNFTHSKITTTPLRCLTIYLLKINWRSCGVASTFYKYFVTVFLISQIDKYRYRVTK